MFWFSKPDVRFGELGLLKDVHSHVIPGVDDGAVDMENSLKILSGMSGTGVTDLVLTSHINPDVYPANTEELLREKFAGLEAEVASLDSGGAPKLRLGAEYMITGEFHHRDPLTLLQFLPGKVLIEMSYYYLSTNLEDAIFNITCAGLTPVLAHPERYLYLAGHLDVFGHCCDMGCQMQLNILSLSGVYGDASVHIMEHLLKHGMYSYIGSDTHTLSHFNSLSTITVRKKYLESVKELVASQNELEFYG